MELNFSDYWFPKTITQLTIGDNSHPNLKGKIDFKKLNKNISSIDFEMCECMLNWEDLKAFILLKYLSIDTCTFPTEVVDLTHLQQFLVFVWITGYLIA